MRDDESDKHYEGIQREPHGESVGRTGVDDIPERLLQRAMRRLLRDPSRVWTTSEGERLQVLAPGRVNVHEGPDFLDMAVLLGASVLVGAAEFHRRASDWMLHRHDDDALYSRVILHIVCEHDSHLRTDLPTLVIDAHELRSHLSFCGDDIDDTAADEVQAYALMRLMRRIGEHAELMKTRTAEEVFAWSVHVFLVGFTKKRHRPHPDEAIMASVRGSLPLSAHQRFIAAMAQGTSCDIDVAMEMLQQTAIAHEGWLLRSEVLTNCVLPCALASAADTERIGLFQWYWSRRAFHAYASLRRMFRKQSQEFMWQQQGLLEIAREKRTDSRVHEMRILYEVMKKVGRGGM